MVSFAVNAAGPVAQRLEQTTHNRLVAGSNPAGSTIHFSESTLRDLEHGLYNSLHQKVIQLCPFFKNHLIFGFSGHIPEDFFSVSLFLLVAASKIFRPEI